MGVCPSVTVGLAVVTVLRASVKDLHTSVFVLRPIVPTVLYEILAVKDVIVSWHLVT